MKFFFNYWDDDMLDDPDHLVTWSLHSNGFNNFVFLKQLLLKYIIKKKDAHNFYHKPWNRYFWRPWL